MFYSKATTGLLQNQLLSRQKVKINVQFNINNLLKNKGNDVLSLFLSP